MFWLLPPPYLRWLAAAVVFAGAAYLDLAGPAMQPYPFAATSIESGAPLAANVEWRDVPTGLLPPAATTEGFAVRDLAAGDPITAAAVRSDDQVPDGWWSVPVELPASARPGVSVRLLSPQGGLDVIGIVTEPAATGAFATVSAGLVAVPPDAAADIAAAGAAGALIVLLEA